MPAHACPVQRPLCADSVTDWGIQNKDWERWNTAFHIRPLFSRVPLRSGSGSSVLPSMTRRPALWLPGELSFHQSAALPSRRSPLSALHLPDFTASLSALVAVSGFPFSLFSLFLLPRLAATSSDFFLFLGGVKTPCARNRTSATACSTAPMYKKNLALSEKSAIILSIFLHHRPKATHCRACVSVWWKDPAVDPEELEVTTITAN